jgi:hypothetical protein
VKWDGFRLIVTVPDDKLSLRSRPGSNGTDWFPELAVLPPRLEGHDAVLDGEVVICGNDGGLQAGLELASRLQMATLVRSGRSGDGRSLGAAGGALREAPEAFRLPSRRRVPDSARRGCR